MRHIERALKPRRRVATNSQTRDDILQCDAAWHLAKEKSWEMDMTLGHTKVDLDAVDVRGQTMEMVFGNFFADVFRAQHETDVALMHGDGVRGNKAFDASALPKKVLIEMHLFRNSIVRIHVTWEELRDYISVVLQCYEDICGGFLQVSGLRYMFDSKAPASRCFQSLSYPKGKSISSKDKLMATMTYYQLAIFLLKHDKPYSMVTLSDVVPLASVVFDAEVFCPVGGVRQPT